MKPLESCFDMSEIADFEIGQVVELSDGRSARVLFVGTTLFATGDWLGVVLEDSSGKNDGAVQGYRYFDCEAGHGMFLRPSAATILAQTSGPIRKSSVLGAKGNRTTAAGERQSMLESVSKRQSLKISSPTPDTRATAGIRSLRVSIFCSGAKLI